MAPELKEMYIAGDTAEDFKYDPWKSDVYALGMTLMDAACLKLGQKTSKNDKMIQISELYGEDYVSFLELCLEENPETRCDFVKLTENSLFFNLSFQKNTEKLKVLAEEERKTEEIVPTKVKTSEKLYNFIEKLPKNNKMSKFYQILTEIKKIEEANQTDRETLERNIEKSTVVEKVPENYFKYFDCQ